LFLARTLAALFFVNRLDHVALVEKSKKYVVYNGIPFVIFFLIFLVRTLLTEGFAVDPGTGMVAMEKMKYLHNFMQMPIVLVMFLLGVAAVLYGIAGTVFKNDFRKGIWYSGIGTVLTVTMLLLIAGYNHTAYYPSTYDLQSSLTIQNSSSSELTLRVMFYVSLLVPIVIGYIAYAWRLLEKKRLSIEDLKADEHAY
jgi:cytochrome d ubiquinol oxidase subunit II